MRKAREMTGWDSLAALLLTLGCARHALEYDAYRGLTCTAVYLLLTTSHAVIGNLSSRRWHQILNIATGLAVAAYPFLKWNGHFPIAAMPLEPVVPAGFVYLLTALAGLITVYKLYHYLQLAPHLDRCRDSFTSERNNSGWRSILEQKYMPKTLSVWRFVPLTFLGICIYGMALALPVGPLSDDGMILFMEGGCDWGNSSVFFYSKLGLLVAINAAMIIALREHFKQVRMVLPHFLGLAGLMAVYWDDYSCGITQGNTAQMIAEMAALALLMIAALPTVMSMPPRKQLLILGLINAWHISVFEFGLLYFAHWTWSHTVTVVVLTLLPTVFAIKTRAEGCNVGAMKQPSV